MAARRTVRPLTLLILAAFAVSLAACWVIPYRLGFGSQGSYYTFGYVGDEYTYAHRMQPLIAGTTALNPINRACDPNVISPFYLEDACRGLINLAHTDVISFIWVWRFVFPLVLGLTLVLLAFECLPRSRTPWAQPLRLAAAAAIFPLLYCLYDLVTPFPPLQGWLNRVPTNIEYPLSVLLAWLYVRFLKQPTRYRAVALACGSAAMVYLRFYIAIPWAALIIVSLPALIYLRFVPWRAALCALIVVLLALAPWLIVARWNSGSEIYAQFLQRYFGPPVPYKVHPQWLLYSIFALLFLGGSLAFRAPWRQVLAAAGLALLILIFVTGLMQPFVHELHDYDRFGSFYLVVLVTAVMLLAGQWSTPWRGKTGAVTAGRASRIGLGVALVAAVVLGARNAQYDFLRYPFGPYPSIARDLASVESYKWIADNTPADALFLVDNGYDWDLINNETDANKRAAREHRAWLRYISDDDLFLMVARRQRVHHLRIYGDVLSDADYSALKTLQFGTFGGPGTVPKAEYESALARVRPDYVLWRKTAPVPRAYGAALLERCEKAHADDACEIWKLRDLPAAPPTP